MHERKHQMFERSDAFIAMPGGIGTLEDASVVIPAIRNKIQEVK